MSCRSHTLSVSKERPNRRVLHTLPSPQRRQLVQQIARQWHTLATATCVCDAWAVALLSFMALCAPQTGSRRGGKRAFCGHQPAGQLPNSI
jgi:hypothetical protein